MTFLSSWGYRFNCNLQAVRWFRMAEKYKIFRNSWLFKHPADSGNQTAAFACVGRNRFGRLLSHHRISHYIWRRICFSHFKMRRTPSSGYRDSQNYRRRTKRSFDRTPLEQRQTICIKPYSSWNEPKKLSTGKLFRTSCHRNERRIPWLKHRHSIN